jgi:hypothetical protein
MGVSGFMTSMTTFQQVHLKEATAKLTAAEDKTWKDMERAQKEPTAFRSAIYPPGTEYALSLAISQVAFTFNAVLTGSLMEALKGFYKLRKAMLTLDSIMVMEANHLKRMTGNGNTTGPANGSANIANGQFGIGRTANDIPLLDENLEKQFAGLDTEGTPTSMPAKRLDTGAALPAEVFTHPTDIFIHTGSHLCYGTLLVTFSLVKPVFNRVLSIVGFSGDRERGVKLVWEATKFFSFNSATAGLALLGYYHGLSRFSDVLPTDTGAEDDLTGYPKAKVQALLTSMLARYPDSNLWKLEEARLLAYNKDLTGAVEIITKYSASDMKPVSTSFMFEKALNTMYLHDYELSAVSWLNLLPLNEWTHTLYYYQAASAYLELYRNLRDSNPTTAETYKNKAAELFRKAPPLAGRQKMMGKVMPFDVFIKRKVQKWEERARAWSVDFIDAIGTSPLTEMMYLWNGFQKMAPGQLEKSLEILQWHRTSQSQRFKNDLDESGLHALLRAAVLRNQEKFTEAKKTLEIEILSHDKSQFTGTLKDCYICPSAHYEMGVLAWKEKDLEGVSKKAKVLECEEWLGKVEKWDIFVLDTRVGFKLKGAQITVQRERALLGI